jgi:flagellar L-ring protein precursor FlgH
MTRLTILVSVLAMIVSGCGSSPTHDEISMRPAGAQQAYAPASDGTIYRSGTEVRLFEDLKAGRVGDILTVRLTERTNASKNSQTQTTKTSAVTLNNPTVLGRPVTRNGVPLLDGSLDGSQSFDGTGTSSQSNSLTGDITVTVIDRLPNGNLRIQGEKWLTINQGREFIRVNGIIRPNDIEPDNSVASTRIADAQIAYSAKGALAAANRMGIFSRFFQSILHPF